MPSFDIVSEINEVEVRNAQDQANKEVSTRFDFKDSDARIEYTDSTLTIFADDEFKLTQVYDILKNKLTKRGIDLRSLEKDKEEIISGGKMKQKIKVKSGIEKEFAKQITKKIKESKIKVQASIQGDSVRISGNKRDDLQDVIAMLKTEITSLPLQFNNFRD